MSGNRQHRSQADSSTLYSGAQSFLSFLEKGVDPRTGTYSIRIAMPEIAVNALSGPDIVLSVSFSAMQNVDLGLGIGWSWGTSRLAPASKRLTLSNGETHLAILSEDDIAFPDRKLPTFKAERLENAVLITFRSGRSERLERFDPTDPVSPYVPVEIRSPEGHAMQLAWTSFGGNAALSAVFDHDDRELLSVSRDAAAVTISVATSEGAMAAFRLNLSGDLVSSISLPTPESAAWKLGYTRYTEAELPFLTRVESPTGSVETIVYKEDGHAIPLRATDPPDKEPERTPYVVRYVMDPGAGQPQRISTYEYSTENYLGFGAGVDWEDSTDTLYKVRTDYRFDSTEKQLDAEGKTLVTIYREYDRFHAMRIERRTQGDCIQEMLEDFHDVPGQTWYEQSNLVELPSRRVMRYERDGVSREDVRTFRYDTWGNPVEETGPDGIVERTTYYDPAGEDGCPPDPVWASPRKEKTVVRAPAVADDTVSPTTVTYRYALLSSLAPGAPAHLLCESQCLSTKDGEYASVGFDYHDVPDSTLLHGRLHSKTETVGGFATTTTFTYEIVGNELVIDETTTTDFDETSTHTKVHRSVFSGLETRREDDEEILRYEHDALGRVTWQSVEPATGERAYAASVEHVYGLPEQSGGDVTHQTRSPSGIVVTRHFDGTGLVVGETRASPAPKSFVPTV
ncbi:hypothetical protein [Pandoraea anhela]|uniref:tRNA(Glu)-specific nuclease WapA n=1 Tax=Pandoraea anhela TaxID=2508295 RepID=A0A5E4TTL5_9BURK|nr:hypothetical protein [Pandoraea anhela]VVD91210.1 tRNA(Glu)-specific nuclease WapA [Pandoraea anhela]